MVLNAFSITHMLFRNCLSSNGVLRVFKRVSADILTGVYGGGDEGET